MTKRFFEQGCGKAFRTDAGSRKLTVSVFTTLSSIFNEKRSPNHCKTSCTSRSGTLAPTVKATDRTSANQFASICPTSSSSTFSLLRDRPIPAADANLNSSRSPERWRIHIRSKPRATLRAGSASRSRHPLLEAGAVREIVISTPQGLRWFRRCSALSASEPLRAPDFESADYRSLPSTRSFESAPALLLRCPRLHHARGVQSERCCILPRRIAVLRDAPS